MPPNQILAYPAPTKPLILNLKSRRRGSMKQTRRVKTLVLSPSLRRDPIQAQPPRCTSAYLVDSRRCSPSKQFPLKKIKLFHERYFVFLSLNILKNSVREILWIYFLLLSQMKFCFHFYIFPTLTWEMKLTSNMSLLLNKVFITDYSFRSISENFLVSPIFVFTFQLKKAHWKVKPVLKRQICLPQKTAKYSLRLLCS